MLIAAMVMGLADSVMPGLFHGVYEMADDMLVSCADRTGTGRNDPRFPGLCAARAEVCVIIAEVARKGWVWKLCRDMAAVCRNYPGLIHAAEVARALSMDRGSMRCAMEKHSRYQVAWARGRPSRADEELISAAAEAVPFLIGEPEMIAMGEADPEQRDSLSISADGNREMIIEETPVGVDGNRGGLIEGVMGCVADDRNESPQLSPQLSPRISESVAENGNGEAETGAGLLRELAEVLECDAHPSHVVDAVRSLVEERVEREDRPKVGRGYRGRIDRSLRADRLHREETKRSRVEAENDRLSKELGTEKEISERLRRQHGKATECLAQERANSRRLEEKCGSLQAQLIVAKAGLEASRLAREEDKGIIAKQVKQIEELSQSGDLRRLLRDSQSDRERLERENQFLRGEIRALTSQVDGLREENSTVKGEEDRLRAENSVLTESEARARYNGSLAYAREAGEASMLLRFPFLKAHTEFVLDKCGRPGARGLAYPERIGRGEGTFECRDAYVLMSECGEYHWQCMRSLCHFPTWRTVQRWRGCTFQRFELGRGIFDGSPSNAVTLVRLCKERLRGPKRCDHATGIKAHPHRLTGAVACDAVAAMADVAVKLTGEVTGLKQPMQIDPDYAAYLVNNPEAYAAFGADLHRRGLVVHALHVITFVSPVPGVPVMVLRVIPAEHGKATADVNASVYETVRMLGANGIDVRWVCTDGDSTYVQTLATAFARVRELESYNLWLPSHRQTELASSIFIPETKALYCSDVDHQGKAMRYVYVKGGKLVVFPVFGDGWDFYATNSDVLRCMGIPEALLRDTPSTKMDDSLAAKLFSGGNLVVAADMLRYAMDAVDAFGNPPAGLSKWDLAAWYSSLNDSKDQMRSHCAAYWLHVCWVSVYQTLHREIPPLHRALVAAYGFCTVLLMFWMRRYVPAAHRPAERHSQRSGRFRWAMNEETCKKYLITLFAILCGLGAVTAPIRANVFGTLPLERFFSCVRRVCRNNDHFQYMMDMLRTALMMTTLRTGLGLSPDLEEGTKRQKHGDVLIKPLPPDDDGLPMGRVLSLVLTAMVRSRVVFPEAFIKGLASIGVCVLADAEPCFIEELVSFDGDPKPTSATLRNTRIVTTGGAGPMKKWRAAAQLAHADDGPVDAATPPSPGGLWFAPVGPAPWAVLGVPFDPNPPS
jgi:hypothetical protein